MLPEGFDPTGGWLGLVGRGASQGASPLAFEFVCLFFSSFSCLPSHHRIDQPGRALSHNQASRVRPLVCQQHPKGGMGSRAAAGSPRHRGLGTPHPAGNAAMPAAPFPP